MDRGLFGQDLCHAGDIGGAVVHGVLPAQFLRLRRHLAVKADVQHIQHIPSVDGDHIQHDVILSLGRIEGGYAADKIVARSGGNDGDGRPLAGAGHHNAGSGFPGGAVAAIDHKMSIGIVEARLGDIIRALTGSLRQVDFRTCFLRRTAGIIQIPSVACCGIHYVYQPFRHTVYLDLCKYTGIYVLIIQGIGGIVKRGNHRSSVSIYFTDSLGWSNSVLKNAGYMGIFSSGDTHFRNSLS